MISQTFLAWFFLLFSKKNTIWTGKLAVKTWLVSLTNDYTYFVWLTHRPTTHLHPMIQDSSHECERTRAPLNIVHRFIQAPSSTTTSGPIVTLGPILQFLPILAVGSCIQRKTLLYCTLCQIKNLYFKFCVLFYGHSSSKYMRVYIKMTKINTLLIESQLKSIYIIMHIKWNLLFGYNVVLQSIKEQLNSGYQ